MWTFSILIHCTCCNTFTTYTCKTFTYIFGRHSFIISFRCIAPKINIPTRLYKVILCNKHLIVPTYTRINIHYWSTNTYIWATNALLKSNTKCWPILVVVKHITTIIIGANLVEHIHYPWQPVQGTLLPNITWFNNPSKNLLC